MNFEDRIFPREGQRPLAIKARELGVADTSISPSGQKNTRWQECTIYQTPKGFLAHVVGKTKVSGEVDRHWVGTGETPAQLAKVIETHYGEIHKAVDQALKRAGVYEQSAEMEGEAYVEEVVDNPLERCVYFSRPNCVAVYVNHDKTHDTISITHGSQTGMPIESAENFAMSILDAVLTARNWRDEKS